MGLSEPTLATPRQGLIDPRAGNEIPSTKGKLGG